MPNPVYNHRLTDLYFSGGRVDILDVELLRAWNDISYQVTPETTIDSDVEGEDPIVVPERVETTLRGIAGVRITSIRLVDGEEIVKRSFTQNFDFVYDPSVLDINQQGIEAALEAIKSDDD